MSEMGYIPPYTITDKTVNLISAITEIITKITINDQMSNNTRLRRDSRIRMIHASLAIENNSLSLNQVTDIIKGRRMLGAPDEICEVKNAFATYEILLHMNPYYKKDMLKAHGVLMRDLTRESGIFRDSGVGVFADQNLVHMAPPAERVPQLISELLAWLKRTEAHPLVKSCVFHYEFEFIHPFADGNGRMGRMWQTLLLYNWNSVFGWLPIETLIRERQGDYYRVLGECDELADSGKFIEFLLQAILDSLKEIAITEQVLKLLECIGDEAFSTRELMERLGLKHRPTFRNNYLLPALEAGHVEMTIPDKPNSNKQKYRKS
ncbi:MAG: Fic family protein [Suipraeoptans sp.]